MSVEWSWQRAADSLPILIDGFKITLLATVLGMAIASVLGLVIAIARRTCPAYVRVPLRWITEFIRLTPLVVQLLFVYYLLPQFSALQIGIAVLGVHYSTYMAEVYRAGIEAVPAGQWEAARALSLPTTRTWRAVVLPPNVDGDVRPAVEHGGLHLLHEDAATADPVERDVLAAVALGRDDDELYLDLVG